MKHYKIVLPAAAMFALMGSTSVFAQEAETRSFSASVSGALQGDTGFLTGGQVQVQGVGQGAMNITRTAADITVLSGARGGLTLGVPESSSSMVTTFDFDRTVDTAAALVGVGNVIAQGDSLGGVGVVGTATANATRAGTEDDNGILRSGSAASPTSAQGSLVGQFQTQNTMQLQGQGSLFAGAQSLDIGERNAGIAAGLTGTVSAGATEVDLSDLVLDVSGAPSVTSGAGAGFSSTTNLVNDSININVANAGQGSILVSGSTGGFFGQGTTFGATAAPTFAQTNGFFNP
jgi:stage V sporulation protein SpoVS